MSSYSPICHRFDRSFHFISFLLSLFLFCFSSVNSLLLLFPQSLIKNRHHYVLNEKLGTIKFRLLKSMIFLRKNFRKMKICHILKIYKLARPQANQLLLCHLRNLLYLFIWFISNILSEIITVHAISNFFGSEEIFYIKNIFWKKIS